MHILHSWHLCSQAFADKLSKTADKEPAAKKLDKTDQPAKSLELKKTAAKNGTDRKQDKTKAKAPHKVTPAAKKAAKSSKGN